MAIEKSAGGNEGFNQLARVMQKRMQDLQGALPVTVDFGEIKADFSLQLNTFQLPIPVTDYLVCRTLTLGKVGAWLTDTKAETGQHPHGKSGQHDQHLSGDGSHEHPDSEGGHLHPVLIPEKMRGLMPGDRVLVLLVGNDPVVVDLIFPANRAV